MLRSMLRTGALALPAVQGYGDNGNIMQRRHDAVSDAEDRDIGIISLASGTRVWGNGSIVQREQYRGSGTKVRVKGSTVLREQDRGSGTEVRVNGSTVLREHDRGSGTKVRVNGRTVLKEQDHVSSIKV